MCADWSSVTFFTCLSPFFYCTVIDKNYGDDADELLTQIGCQGTNDSIKLCGEARPELLAFNCSVVELEFKTDIIKTYRGFRLSYSILHAPLAGKIHIPIFNYILMEWVSQRLVIGVLLLLFFTRIKPLVAQKFQSRLKNSFDSHK